MTSFAAQTWMFFHIFIILSKIIFTIMTLSDSCMPYIFLSLLHLSFAASISKVNLICEKARYRDTFIVNWLIDNVNWNKFSLFLTSKFMFYYLITVKFLQNRALLWKNFKKKLYIASTLLGKKQSVIISEHRSI